MDSQDRQQVVADKQVEPSNVRKKTIGALKTAVDNLAKLSAPFGVLAAAIIANNYQSSMTAATLLSQREQADSALRAGMFHDLIGPMTGTKNEADISIDREQLLVELLALNFDEHFELKPLMTHVDSRLLAEQSAEMTPEQRQQRRNSLRSVARRIQQRQLAMLTKVDDVVTSGDSACIYRFDMSDNDTPAGADQNDSAAACGATFHKKFDDLISMISPSHRYAIDFVISKPDNWADQSFDVAMTASPKARLICGPDEQDKAKLQLCSMTVAQHDFPLTWFDFPFTDNTLLADGTRFALVLDDVRSQENRAIIKLVWFPRDYFSPRERPINHKQFREQLGLEPKK